MTKNVITDLEKSFFETTPLGVYQTTRDGVIIAANRTFLHMLGITKRQLSTINLNEYDLGSLYPRKKFIDRVEKDHQVIGLEYKWKKKDGTVIYVRENARVVRDRKKVLYYEGTIEDITDRKKVELKLIESQKKLKEAQKKLTFLNEMARRLAKSMDYETRLHMLARICVPRIADWCSIDIVTDMDTLKNIVVEHVNPKKMKLARTLKRMYPPDQKRQNGIWNVIKTGKPISISKVTKNMLISGAKDEKHAQLLMKMGLHSLIILPLIARGKTIGAVMFGNSEKRAGFTHADFLFAQHITHRAATLTDNARLYNEALEEEKRRDHFLGIASHELKNTLAGIKSYTQLLQRKLKDDEKINDYLHRIDMNTNRMKRLMDDLIDLTKLKSQKLTLIVDTFEINALVREVVDEFKILTKTHAIVVSQAPPTFLSADRTRIRQVVTNLIKNALKYSPGASKIHISIQRLDSAIQVSVQDFGIGIEKYDQKKVFNLFYRVEDEETKTNGLGVGLYISHEIIKLHKGKMNVLSMPGKGSTFSFIIPIHTEVGNG